MKRLSLQGLTVQTHFLHLPNMECDTVLSSCYQLSVGTWGTVLEVCIPWLSLLFALRVTSQMLGMSVSR